MTNNGLLCNITSVNQFRLCWAGAWFKLYGWCVVYSNLQTAMFQKVKNITMFCKFMLFCHVTQTQLDKMFPDAL